LLVCWSRGEKIKIRHRVVAWLCWAGVRYFSQASDVRNQALPFMVLFFLNRMDLFYGSIRKLFLNLEF
jgi:hypothetical protein